VRCCHVGEQPPAAATAAASCCTSNGDAPNRQLRHVRQGPVQVAQGTKLHVLRQLQHLEHRERTQALHRLQHHTAAQPQLLQARERSQGSSQVPAGSDSSSTDTCRC
jgi:hypothetical protein